MKKRDLTAVAFLAIIVCIAAGIRIWNRLNVPDGFVLVNNRMVKVLYADTYERQYRGLGGRDDIGEYEGMYFIFPFEGKLSMVMRDMRFPIDVIWLKSGEVVDIRKDLRPEQVRKGRSLTVYENSSPADSFLELRAGGSDRLNIKVGDKLIFCKEAEKCGN